jgi:hypothetical protein
LKASSPYSFPEISYAIRLVLVVLVAVTDDATAATVTAGAAAAAAHLGFSTSAAVSTFGVTAPATGSRGSA